jgi:addiction module RelB/DinJ family antitoxin
VNSALLNIRTNEQTKKQIKDFATSLGLSTSAFVTAVLLQVVREKRVVLTSPLEPTIYLEKVMHEADADIKTGTNLSKVYDNAEDFFKDLEKNA